MPTKATARKKIAKTPASDTSLSPQPSVAQFRMSLLDKAHVLAAARQTTVPGEIIEIAKELEKYLFGAVKP